MISDTISWNIHRDITISAIWIRNNRRLRSSRPGSDGCIRPIQWGGPSPSKIWQSGEYRFIDETSKEKQTFMIAEAALNITNCSGVKVKSIPTPEVVSGCIQGVNIVPLVTDVVNRLQGWFLLPDGVTKD